MNTTFTQIRAHRGTLRTATILAALVSLILTMVTPFVGTAYAQIDAWQFDAADATLDTHASIVSLPDVCGNKVVDDGPINGASTKLNVIHNDAPPTIDEDISHPGHSDLCGIWMGSDISPAGEFLLYLAWSRFAPNGSSGAYWEFHHEPLTCATAAADCNPFAGRVAGDFIIHFDFEGNTLNDISLRFFDGTSFGPEVAPADYLPDPAGEASTSEDKLFGEAVLNLTELQIIDPNSDECESLAGVIPGSATGNSDSSDYKDIVLTDINPGITNCGSIQVVKQVTGGDDYDTDFPITLGDGNELDRTENLGHGESFTEMDLHDSQTYTVSEDLAGLDGWAIDSISCDDDTSNEGETSLSGITVTAGETTVCTVTNTPDLPTITLEKTVDINYGGDAVEDDFQASLTTVGDVDWDATTQVEPGSYTASETTLPGYEASSWGEDCADDGSVTVGLGDHVTCTITNSDLPGQITLIKKVINDNGGTASATGFGVNAEDMYPDMTGETPDDGYDSQASGTLTELSAGEYTIGEDGLPGYVQTSIDCGRYGSTESADPIDIEIGLDADVTCTIVNDDLPPGLNVVKQVTPGYNGTATADDFTLEVYAGNDDSGDLVASDIGSLTTIPDAGTYYVKEVIPANLVGQYEQSSISCTSDQQDGAVGTADDNGGIVITVGLGETISCTIVNNPIPGEITLVKQVINDNGGTADANDFGVYAGDNQPDLDVADVADDGYDSTGSATLENLDAGTYTIGEDGLTGYTQTDISCDVDTEPGQAEGTLELDLGLGDEVTCTIVNDDDPISLTVIKQVINDHNGPAEADEFGVYVDNDTLEMDVADVADDGYDSTGSETLNDLTVGTYTVGELGLDGYTQDSISCDGANEPGDKVGTIDVSLELGDHVTCTIVNNDDPVGLTVIKEVQNNWGGDLTDASFPLYVDETLVTTGEETFVGAGTYDISEVQQDGYEHVSSTCLLDNEPYDVEGKETVSVTVLNGEHVVCTFVNRDVPASLTVLKEVVNDDGGTAVVSDFTAVVNSENSDWGSQDITIGEQTGVAIGDYTIGEIGLEGYEMTDISCSDETTLTEGDTVTVALGHGDAVTCTITNDDIAPTVVLRKNVVNNDGGALTQDDFPVSLDGTTVAWDDVITIMAGDHTAAETSQDGYAASQWGGDCTGNGTFTAEPGGVYECTITNDDVPAGLTVVKQVINDDGGTANVANFDLGITPSGGDRQSVLSGTASVVAAGTYTIDEIQIAGYEMTGITCDDGTTLADDADSVTVTVGNDESVVCTIVNDDLPVGISVVKVADQEFVVFDAEGDPVVVTYTYTVTNTGSTTLSDLSLFDDILGEITLPGDTLPIGGVMIGTATHTVTQADADAGTIVNVADVEGTSPDGRTVTDSDDEIVDVAEVAGIQIIEEPVLPATGYDTQRLALLSALAAALGLVLLLLSREGSAAVSRRED